MNIFYVPFLKPLCEGSIYSFNRIKAFFINSGWKITTDVESAEIYLLNTCVHLESQRKYSEELVNTVLDRTEERRERGAKLVIIGCLAGFTDRYRSFKNVECINPKQIHRFNDMIDTCCDIETVDACAINKIGIHSCQTHYLSDLHTTTSYIQISVGCHNRCSYCVVPRCIGPSKSRLIEDVLADVNSCRLMGQREFTLHGEDCGSYGIDIGTNIADLTDRILDLDSGITLNIMNLHPAYLLKHFDRLLPHFQYQRIKYVNIPIQSMSNRILKLMNRPYNIGETLDAVETIRELNDSLWMTTHLIFGFPSETRTEFEELMNVGNAFNEKLYILYSDHDGLPASRLKPKIGEKESVWRVSRLREHLKRNNICGQVVVGPLKKPERVTETMAHPAQRIEMRLELVESR